MNYQQETIKIHLFIFLVLLSHPSFIFGSKKIDFFTSPSLLIINKGLGHLITFRLDEVGKNDFFRFGNDQK